MDVIILKMSLNLNSSPMNVLNGNLETIEAARFRDLKSKVNSKQKQNYDGKNHGVVGFHGLGLKLVCSLT